MRPDLTPSSRSGTKRYNIAGSCTPRARGSSIGCRPVIIGASGHQCPILIEEGPVIEGPEYSVYYNTDYVWALRLVSPNIYSGPIAVARKVGSLIEVELGAQPDGLIDTRELYDLSEGGEVDVEIVEFFNQGNKGNTSPYNLRSIGGPARIIKDGAFVTIKGLPAIEFDGGAWFTFTQDKDFDGGIDAPRRSIQIGAVIHPYVYVSPAVGFFSNIAKTDSSSTTGIQLRLAPAVSFPSFIAQTNSTSGGGHTSRTFSNKLIADTDCTIFFRARDHESFGSSWSYEYRLTNIGQTSTSGFGSTIAGTGLMKEVFGPAYIGAFSSVGFWAWKGKVSEIGIAINNLYMGNTFNNAWLPYYSF